MLSLMFYFVLETRNVSDLEKYSLWKASLNLSNDVAFAPFEIFTSLRPISMPIDFRYLPTYYIAGGIHFRAALKTWPAERNGVFRINEETRVRWKDSIRFLAENEVVAIVIRIDIPRERRQWPD